MGESREAEWSCVKAMDREELPVLRQDHISRPAAIALL
jgi:hypothetical protein